MKHPVSDDLKSICDQIAAMGLSAAEWTRHDKAAFYRGSCMCSFNARYRKKGAFFFLVNGEGDFTSDAAPMLLEDILRISNGQIREIEVEPRAGVPPQGAGIRRVEADPEVLHAAINDGINVYVRDVLIPRGIVNIELFNNDRELNALKHQVAEYWAQRWKVSWVNDGF